MPGGARPRATGPPPWTAPLHRGRAPHPRTHSGRRRVSGHLCRLLSAPLPDPAAADIDALTVLLARGNPAPYAGTVRLPAHGVEVATASLELLLGRTGRTVESGPIKGTGRTAGDPGEGPHESAMIVDLVRNDLGQVCATGSVTVSGPVRRRAAPRPGAISSPPCAGNWRRARAGPS
ncbi:chorismate-binding protein [Streptomyces sp. NPDC006265]|uniref:chorismate-binding protein n=1 Tax=Streptomyces sp. NPDC006265 TaxID=3156740 RepID=UPI0033B821B5